jgi:hypothetical protein
LLDNEKNISYYWAVTSHGKCSKQSVRRGCFDRGGTKLAIYYFDPSVASFDDISFSSYALLRLTMVSGKAEEIGRDASRLHHGHVAELIFSR